MHDAPSNALISTNKKIYFILQGNENAQANNTAQENSWLAAEQISQTTVTNHQPAPAGNSSNDVADGYFDFDIPNSPAEDSEYARLVDSSTTPPHEIASESGYVCASPLSSIENSVAVENSDSSDDPYFDPESSDLEQRSLSLSVDYYDCDDLKREASVPLLEREISRNRSSQLQNESVSNGIDNSSSTDSLPKSQSTSMSTFTANTSESNNTLGNDLDITDFCDSSQLPLENEHLTKSETDLCNMISDIETTTEITETANPNSISTNELLQEIGEVQQIPSFDSVGKLTLVVENLVNGDASDNDVDDDEEVIPRPERLRRCSSLKTGKTPPGTPGRKKIVRFADVLGLDLADVRTFMDDIPKVPNSAYDDLQSTLDDLQSTPISLGPRLDKVIVPLFQQPGALPNFLDIVQAQNVSLENAAVTDPICLTISGLARVRNLDFHKSLHVRYSLDAWQSFSDLQAQYVENSCDGFSDKFTFTLFGNSMEVGQRIEIALRYSCKGEQFWDNNHGINYCFQCLPATNPQMQLPNANGVRHDLHLHDSWCGSSFY